MTTPKDIIPTKYEVVKLKTGIENSKSMTRDLGDKVEITLPMICQLSLDSQSTVRTQQLFTLILH